MNNGIYLVLSSVVLLLAQASIFNAQSIFNSLFYIVCSASFLSVPFLALRAKNAFILLAPFCLLGLSEVFHSIYYSGFLSISAIGSVFESNLREATEFFDGKKTLVVLSLLAIAVYCFSLFKINKEYSIPKKFKVAILVSLFLSGAFLGLNVITLKPAVGVDVAELKDKLKKIFPIGTAYNLFAYYKESSLLAHVEKQRQAHKFNASISDATAEQEVYVLILGESSAVKAWSIFGGVDGTNPKLSMRKDILIYPNMLAVATVTRNSVPLMLTRSTALDSTIWHNEGSVLSAFNEVGFSTAWFSNQEKYGRNETSVSIISEDAGKSIFINTTLDTNRHYDGELVDLLKDEINRPGQKKFIILHTLGSHFSYEYRYPQEYAVFKPNMSTYNSSMSDEDKKLRIENSYYNSIVYTDYVVSSVIDLLDKQNIISTVTYISDHGELLFDDGEFSYGHGMSNTHITELKTPFLIWASDEYNARNKNKYKNLLNNENKIINHDVIFHTILDMANINCAIKQDSLALTSDSFRQESAYYLDVNEKPNAYPGNLLNKSSDILMKSSE